MKWQRRARNEDLVPVELFPTKEVKFPTKEVESTPSPKANQLLPIRGIMEGIENNMVCKKCSCSKLSLTMTDCQNDLKAQLCRDNGLDNKKIKEEIEYSIIISVDLIEQYLLCQLWKSQLMLQQK